jgi:hypothetical protein
MSVLMDEIDKLRKDISYIRNRMEQDSIFSDIKRNEKSQKKRQRDIDNDNNYDDYDDDYDDYDDYDNYDNYDDYNFRYRDSSNVSDNSSEGEYVYDGRYR